MLDLVVLMLLALGGISDPGWNYRSPNGTAVMDDGRRFELPEVSGLEPRIHASFFAGSLNAELDVTNVSEAPIEIDTVGLVVRDETGSPLRKRSTRSATCEGTTLGAGCTLQRGQACRITETFNAAPYAPGLSGLLGQRNPLLENLTVTLVPRPRTATGTEIDFATNLVWD